VTEKKATSLSLADEEKVSPITEMDGLAESGLQYAGSAVSDPSALRSCSLR
jgi:hypothetical protein